MDEKEKFELSNFLTDSLSLYNNVQSATRSMFPVEPRDSHLQFYVRDPMEVLGENKFTERKEISENFLGTPIQEFFRTSNIMITGGTGFIGKVLIEKLVRSIPDVGHIYILIRPKKGKTCHERMEQLLEDKVFRRMRTEVPGYRSKISAVNGDISKPRLGLSSADRHLLSDRVHVIFHSAADVRFIEPLRAAVESNVLGSMRLLDLAKEMKHLKSYVHVSTAYSQCVYRVIEERAPKMNISYKEVLHYCEHESIDEIQEADSRIMQGWPNTYTFSKAVCENMIDEEAEGLPICIVRPSIVWPSYKEPFRGWTDNIYGPTGLMLGAELGVLRSFRMDEALGLDTVPVDYVVNYMITAAWNTGAHREDNGVPVYNFTSSPLRHWYWKSLSENYFKYNNLWPYNNAIWCNTFIMTPSYLHDELNDIFLHRIPGWFLDKLAVMAGQRPRLSKVYQRINKLKSVMHYFLFTIWEFRNDNVLALWNKLSEEDRQMFWFDIRDIDMKEYLMLGKLGIRYYYLKEEMENIPAAQRKHKWFRWAHSSLKLVLGLVALKLAVFTAHALPL